MKYLNLLELSLVVGRLFRFLEEVLEGEQVLCYLSSGLVRDGLTLGQLGTSAVCVDHGGGGNYGQNCH